jgi:hypothetical protein
MGFKKWLQLRLHSGSWSRSVALFFAQDGGKLTVIDVTAICDSPFTLASKPSSF